MNLVVSLHDVHPGSLREVERQRGDLRALGVRRMNLLVVPRWHGEEPVESVPEFLAALSQWQEEGDEITLHGWTHSIGGLREEPRHWFWTRLYTTREAEFLVASPSEATTRLTTGRALFESLGWRVAGFIAPAWLMSPPTVPLLRELGFAYTNTRTELLPLATAGRPIHSPSLCYSTRSAWRRGASLVWNRSLARSQRRSALLRISIHPSDIVYPAVWRQILRLTREALHAGRIPRTYAQCVTPGLPRVD